MKNVALCASALLLLMGQAHAQTVPPCAVAGDAGNSYETSASGVYERLVCNGSAFVPLELWTTTGTRTVDFGNDSSTCNASRSGRIRFTGSSWDYCNGTSWTVSGIGGVTATAGGSNGQVQFNNTGSLGANTNFVWDNTNSRLGVGTSGPYSTLHVRGQVKFDNATTATTNFAGGGNNDYIFTTSSSGGIKVIRSTAGSSSGQPYTDISPGTIYVSSGGGGDSFISGGAGLVITASHPTNSYIAFTTVSTERVRIDNAGNMGIGLLGPTAKLDVNGAVKVGTSADTCNAAAGGKIRYNATSKVMEYCNETAWTAM